MKTTFLSVCAAALLTFAVSAANASVMTVDLNTADLDNVTFEPGTVYLDYNAPLSGGSSFDIDGTLAAQSKVTFTYTIGEGGTLRRASMDAYTDSSKESIYIDTEEPKLYDVSPSTLLVMTAFVSDTLREGSLVIKNYTNEIVDIYVMLNAFLKGATKFTFTAEVSAIPLPAALPLFGAGLAGLAFIRRRKAQQA